LFFSDPVPYTVQLSDDGEGPVSCTGTPDAAGDKYLQVRANYAGTSYFINAGQPVTDCRPLAMQVTVPSIQVTKEVACKGEVDCGTFGSSATGFKVGTVNPQFCYKITIVNDGNVAALITNVSDTVIGSLLASPELLDVGQQLVIETNWTHAVTTENTVTVKGISDTTPALPVQDTASANAIVELAAASCSVTANPETVPAGATTPVQYCVTVNNLGDTALLNVAISASKGGTYPVIASLAAKTSTQVCATVQITVPADACSNIVNNVSVSSVTGGQCPVVVGSECSKTIATECAPKADIIKKVACFDVECGSFGDVAYGVKTATQCPVFCYQITITNTSSAVTLTNIVVADPDLDLSGCNFPTSLAPNTGFTCTISGVELCENLKNTATLTGNGGNPVTGVVETDDAQVFIKNAAITCTKQVSLDGQTYANTVEIPGDGQAHQVWYKITVSNTSDAGVTLGNIVVADPNLVACDIVAQVPETLASGASFTVECTEMLTCNELNESIVNTATVSADVVASGDIQCVKDDAGEVIAVSHQCTATVTCKPEGACITRTPGYWFTHWRQPYPHCATLEAAIIANGGKIDLGYLCLSGTTDEVLAKALGMFWSKRNMTSTGRGTNLCRARKQLGIHLIAAIANTTLLGTDPSRCSYMENETVKWFPADLIEQAQKAAACDDLSQIHKLTGLLDLFNNSGDNADFPEGLYPCKADPRGAKAFMKDPTTKETCGNTDNCADGSACN
jgi:hypothetical protein